MCLVVCVIHHIFCPHLRLSLLIKRFISMYNKSEKNVSVCENFLRAETKRATSISPLLHGHITFSDRFLTDSASINVFLSQGFTTDQVLLINIQKLTES